MVPWFARRRPYGRFRVLSVQPLLPFSWRCVSLLTLILILRVLVQPSLATAFVQSKGLGNNASSTTIAVTFDTNVVAGNLLCGCVTWGSTTITVTVADNLNGAHVVVQTLTDTTNSQRMASFYLKNTAAGATTVTATFSATVAFRAIAAHEVSGADTTAPLDGNAGQWQSAPGIGTDAVTSGNFTPLTDGCYIFGGSANSGSNTTLTVGTGYTQRVSVFLDNTRNPMKSEDKIQATAAAVAATFTAGADTSFITVGMAFKPAAAGAAVIKELQLLGVGKAA